MTTKFNTVQRIVLHGTAWQAARHLAVSFPAESSAPHFLEKLKQANCWPAAARWSPQPERSPDTQFSLGFSRHGLERARVPDHVLSVFAMKSPAFQKGAVLRASEHLGATGGRPKQDWKTPYQFDAMDALITVHGRDEDTVDQEITKVLEIAHEAKARTHGFEAAHRLPTPRDETEVKDAAWTHFGFRDGLSRVGITDWTLEEDMRRCNEGSRHSAGEFVLGHPQNSGANPWILGPDGRVLPQPIRSFFHNGSFGVLHQVEQHVEAFEAYVAKCAKEQRLDPGLVRAKLCGRYTDGRPMAANEGAPPEDDFDYAKDTEGELCPFGAHVRRMNPRGADLAHSVRRRPLLRRGLPYGYAIDAERGLMGQFFCASIEDQFEHLVGQWADRVPLGSRDAGGARDPVFGAHAAGDGAFVIPRKGNRPIELRQMEAFAKTVGVAYLFYPSLSTLEGIRETSLWRPRDVDENEE